MPDGNAFTPSEHADLFAALGTKKFGLNLDYSVESIDIVDRMLQAFVGDFHPDDMADRANVMGAGCYVGEVFIREGLADRWVDVNEIRLPGKQVDVPFGVALLCAKTGHNMHIEDGELEECFFIVPITAAINICNGMKTSMKQLYHRVRTIQLCPGAEQAPKPEAN